METNDEWIRDRVGIEKRHVAVSERNSDLAVAVGKQLLAKANRRADELDFVIVATMSADYSTPGVANIVQGQLGAHNAAAFDLGAACAGFVYALDVAAGLLSSPNAKCGLVIGSEVLSRLIDWHDRRTAVLFGDGAGGVLVERDDQQVHSRLRSAGAGAMKLTAGGTPDLSPFSRAEKLPPQFTMAGRAVYNFATNSVPEEVRATLEAAALTTADIDLFLFHQANGRILSELAERLDVPTARVPSNIDHCANTSAASIPILLSELIDSGRVQRGQKLLLCGFGGGLNIANMIIDY
jgi:3-oxoacyl-[acyl-carrier-protein] synthase-3